MLVIELVQRIQGEMLLLGFSYLYGTTGTIYLHGGNADNTPLLGVDQAIGAAGGAVIQL